MRRTSSRHLITIVLLLSGIILLAFSVVSLLAPRPAPEPVIVSPVEEAPAAVVRIERPRRPTPIDPERAAMRPPRRLDAAPRDAPRAASPHTLAISEVHYNPGDARPGTAFIELANAGDAPLDLSGWTLADGVGFTFPGGTVLPPEGRLVVCADRAAFLEAYDLEANASVLGDLEGVLSRGGERISLLDADGRLVDAVDYADGIPFGPEADGHGPSLERLCIDAPAGSPENWRASASAGGTPLAKNSREECPPPVLPVHSPVVINEIHYHPPEDDAELAEFVELHNRTGEPVDLDGWSLRDGIEHRFDRASGTARIEGGGFLLVARDPGALAAIAGVPRERIAGPYGGRLSNRSDRIALADPRGIEVDAVHYRQDGDWPARADGLGSSLQRVSAAVSGWLPRNWIAVAAEHEERRELVLLENGAPVRWFENPGGDDPRFPGALSWHHPDFDDGANGWRAGRLAIGYDLSNPGSQGWVLTRASMVQGLHSILVRIAFDVPADPGELRIPRLFMDWDDGVVVWLNGVEIARRNMTVPAGVEPPWGRDRLSELTEAGGDRSATPAYRHVWTGRPGDLRPGRNVLAIGNYNASPRSSDLFATARLVLAADASDADFTPGAPNAVVARTPPPRVVLLDRSPLEPRSTDAVTIRARVLGAGVERVVLHVVEGSSEEAIAMRREGPPAGPREAVWAATIPPRPDLSVVRFRIEARNTGGHTGRFPHAGNPSPHAGYYVVDRQPRENDDLDVFHMLWNGPLSCGRGVWLPGCVFVHRGTAYLDVRFKYRGDTSCGRPKSGLRVAFNKGDLFDGQSRLNLLGCWEDRAMMREVIGWELFRDVGHPHCRARAALVHGAGNRFHGLFIALEEPDEAYLRRNGLDPGDSLWKCRNSLRGGGSSFDKRTALENGEDSSTITAFARQLSTLRGRELVDFLLANVDVETMIEYQTAKCLISDEDGYEKNWMLFHGRERGPGGEVVHRWAPHAWDLDLSFGQIDLGSDAIHTRKHPLMGTRDHPRHGRGWNGLLEAVFGREAGDYFVKALYGRIWRALEEKFHPEVLLERLDRLDRATDTAARADMARWPRWGAAYRDAEHHRRRLRQYIVERWDFLHDLLLAEGETPRKGEIERVRVVDSRGVARIVYGRGELRRFRYVPAPRLKITELCYDPDEGADLEFIEIRSLEKDAVDISGWSIPAVGFVFPEGSEAPAEGFVIVARDPDAFARRHGDLAGARVFGPYPGRLSNDGEELRLRDSGRFEGKEYYPETIDLVEYGRGEEWPDLRRSHGRSLELVELDLDNDAGRHWRFSARRGGSPGEMRPR